MKVFGKSNIEKIDDFFLTVTKGEIYDKVICHVERLLIEKALERAHGNQIEAANILGINRNTLHAKIKKLNIDAEKYKS